MLPSLADLPAEVLNHIVAHFEIARTLAHLSQTCKRLHGYTKEDGFRVFVRHRFPSIHTPMAWEDAAKGLTALSRAWDRKGLLARRLEPEMDYIDLPLERPGRCIVKRREQTMGFQAVIDCYEDVSSSSWTSRKEVLVWGAGAELIMRVRKTGDEVEQSWQLGNDDDRFWKYDQYHHRNRWITYHEERHKDGRDDIISLNLLRPDHLSLESIERVILGRFSGELERVEFSPQNGSYQVGTRFETDNRLVLYTDVNKTPEPLLAASLSDGTVSLYSACSQSSRTNALANTPVISASKHIRAWSTRFLRHDLLAVGLGPSMTPIQVHTVTPTGVSPSPLRTFTTTFSDGSLNQDTSVYPIVPLSTSSQAGGAEGDLFLSGWFDGAIRLHDLRSPAPYTAIYSDPIDTFSAIYSLLPLGRERFVAGSARHSTIKVFDFRMPGGKAYYAVDADPCSYASTRQPPTPAPKGVCCTYHYENKYNRCDFNVFLDQQERLPLHTRYQRSRSSESPVYSLAASSAYSPFIYAGVEDNVIQIDIMSMMEKHPVMDKHQDPIYKYGARSGAGIPRTEWLNMGPVLNLALIEQTNGAGMMLRSQLRIQARNTQIIPGWDVRWVMHDGI